MGRALFGQDDDLLAEATKRQREDAPFPGVIYAHQLQVTIGACVEDLEVIAKAGEPEDVNGRVEFLPLRQPDNSVFVGQLHLLGVATEYATCSPLAIG